MKKSEYQAYLASREWAVLREQVRERAGGKCERCTVAPHEQTHHLTYERVGAERLEDLMAVCEPCHLFISGKSNYDPFLEIMPDIRKQIDHAGFIRCFCGEEQMEWRGVLPDGDLLESESVGILMRCKSGHDFEAHLSGNKFLLLTIQPRPWK